MSVINNVLKDIENKPSAFTPMELTDVSADEAKSRFKSNSWFTGGIILLTVLLLVAYFVYPLQQAYWGKQGPLKQSNSMLPETNKETEIAAGVAISAELPEAVAEPEPVKTKTEITGLQLNESEGFVELTLKLARGAHSFLKKSSQNRYVFLISNAGRKIITPDISDNVWLDGITIDETELGTEIQFDTTDNVLVETYHTESEQNYYWAIRLKRSISSAIIATPEKTDKSSLSAVTPVDVASLVEPDKSNVNKKVDNIQQQNVKLEIKPVKSAVSHAELLNNASIAIQQRNWGKAQKQLESLMNSSVDKKARVQLLALYKLQKKTASMKLLLSQSLELYPEENNFHIVDAGLLFSEKQFLILINRYKNKQSSKKIINFVAASYQSINQYDSAIDYYKKSLKRDPLQPRKWISLAISQEQSSKFDRALQSYQMALKSGTLTQRLRSFIHKRLQQLGNSQ